jgi:ketosteroid isomerase-like protein
MRTLLIGGALGALAVVLSACGGSSGSSADEEALQRKADIYAISEIERDFHESFSRKDIDQMMGLWAPNATFTVGPGQTATGKRKIRQFWLESTPFQPETNWISDHPAYKLDVSVSGDHGTLYFECHYIDLKTKRVVAVTAADMDVARIGGRWFITNMVGGTAKLIP